MGSIGWLILGYFVLGAVVTLVANVGMVIVAAIKDIRYDMKNAPDMKRADTLDAVIDVSKEFRDKYNDTVNLSDDPQREFAKATLKFLAMWPIMIPRSITIIWNNVKELRRIRNGY